jgi:hypothetical protein
MIKANPLRHGGIIANYKCTAACRHCLYACSPIRTDGFIDEQTAQSLCSVLVKGGCRSLHIGGGEPLLDVEGLISLAKVIKNAGITLEYVETNAFWANDDSAAEVLERLMSAGINMLCISIDPFHAEYVPYGHPLRLAKLCEKSGMDCFLWRGDFLPMLSRLDPAKTYNRLDMEKLISKNYLKTAADKYGLTYGGRALNIETEYYYPRKPAGELTESRPCRRLISGDHFHADLYGRYIPPGCTGIALPIDEAVNGIPPGKYPVFETLLSEGTTGLLRYAESRGFVPAGYPSGCALCFCIRHWLCENAPSPELDAEHYNSSVPSEAR